MIYKKNSDFILEFSEYKDFEYEFLNEDAKSSIKEFFKRIIRRLKDLIRNISIRIQKLIGLIKSNRDKSVDQQKKIDKIKLHKKRNIYRDEYFKMAFEDELLTFDDLPELPKFLKNSISEDQSILTISDTYHIYIFTHDITNVSLDALMSKNKQEKNGALLELYDRIYRKFKISYNKDTDCSIAKLNDVINNIMNTNEKISKDFIKDHVSYYSSSASYHSIDQITKAGIEVMNDLKQAIDCAQKIINDLEKEVEDITDSMSIFSEKIRNGLGRSYENLEYSRQKSQIFKAKHRIQDLNESLNIVLLVQKLYMHMHTTIMSHTRQVIAKLSRSAYKVCIKNGEYYDESYSNTIFNDVEFI